MNQKSTDDKATLVPEQATDPLSNNERVRLEIAEEKLRKIADLYNQELRAKNGDVAITHMAYKLQSVLHELKRTKADNAIIVTLESVGVRLAEIAKILGTDLIWGKEG